MENCAGRCLKRVKFDALLFLSLVFLLFSFSACKKVGTELIDVVSISIDKTSIQLKVGETVTLSATVNPSNASDKTVTWSSSDVSIASVDDGIVKALKIGTATIKAKAGDKTATCSITIVPTEVSSITLDNSSASLKVGETVTLSATVNPSDATDKTVTWTTSDATVATVSNGVVTAKKLGTATITAKAGDKSANCTVKVLSDALEGWEEGEPIEGGI